MADKPNSNNDPQETRPAVRSTTIGKPAPSSKASPASERVVGDAAGASGSNAALLDAIRQSSRLTVSQLEKIDKSINATKKELTKLAKDLEPQIRYYTRKFQRWMLFEEEYYKQSVKLILAKKGVAEQFPSNSPIYRKPASIGGAPVDQAEGSGSQGSGPAGFKTVLKKVGEYAQSPLTLVDDALAKSLEWGWRLISGATRRTFNFAKELRKQQAEEAARQATEEKVEQDDSFRKYEDLIKDQKALEEEAALEEAPEAGAPSEESIPYASTASPTDTMSVATLYVGEMVVSGMSLLTDGLSQTERNVTPEANLLEGSTLPANILQFPGASYYDVDEAKRAGERRPESPLMITATAGVLGGTSPDDQRDPFSPGGFFSGKGAADDARIIEVMDDHADDAMDFSEAFLGPVVDFFSNPENTPVGKFLDNLLGGSSSTRAAVDSTTRVELPKWLQTAVFALLGMLLPVALGLAAFLIVGAIVLALVAAVFLPFLQKVLPAIADGIVAFVNMLKDFFADPGEFIAKFAEGIASAMTSVLGALIELIAKAFNEIPILKTLADFFERTMVTISSLIDSIFGFFTTAIDSLAKLVASAIGLPTAIINGLTNVFKAIFDNIANSLNLISALVILIVGVVGTAILTAIIKILGAVDWIGAFFKAGGLNPLKTGDAVEKANAAYDRTISSYVTLTKSFADNMKEGEAKKNAQAISQAVETQLKGKATSDPASSSSSSQASSTTVNNQSTTINSNPGFYGIPIYGGGF